MGEKARTDADGDVTKGGDHDPPAQEKLVPFGIVRVASGALMLRFGSRETRDAGVAALPMGWRPVREKQGNGGFRNGLKVVLHGARRMNGKGMPPTVTRFPGADPDGVRVGAKEMKPYEARLQRSATLPKYDIVIKPRVTESQVSYTRRGRVWHRLAAAVRGYKLLSGRDLGTASSRPDMRTISFTAEDRPALAHDRYHHPDPRVQRKMEVLWLGSALAQEPRPEP